MSRVSHFQRFSQPENHATNNTLLAFRFFYQSSPFKLQRVLTSLLESDLSIGLTFEQQIKGQGSVPDALITQETLKIYIETKRGGALDHDQIHRHISTIKTSSAGKGEILLGITKEPISEIDRQALISAAASEGVTFTAVTFAEIVEALREHEGDLVAIVDDYESYLAEHGLLEERNQWLIVVPCGTSINENVRFNLYYEPASRSCKRNYRFLGLYTQKAVAFIGAVETIAVASYSDDGSAEIVPEAGILTEHHRTSILNAVSYTSYYDLKASPHRFYLVDTFVPFGLKKVSPGGIQGLRYIDLSKVSELYNPRIDYTASQIAEMLRSGSWD
jgi:hypothetical protein